MIIKFFEGELSAEETSLLGAAFISVLCTGMWYLFHRNQVNLRSDLWVQMSVTHN